MDSNLPTGASTAPASLSAAASTRIAAPAAAASAGVSTPAAISTAAATAPPTSAPAAATTSASAPTTSKKRGLPALAAAAAEASGAGGGASPSGSNPRPSKRGKRDDTGGDLWDEHLDRVLRHGMTILPNMGRRTIWLEDDDQSYGRNGLLGEYIRRQTGKVRNRTQVASHIAVLRKNRPDDTELQTLVIGHDITPEAFGVINWSSLLGPDLHPHTRENAKAANDAVKQHRDLVVAAQKARRESGVPSPSAAAGGAASDAGGIPVNAEGSPVPNGAAPTGTPTPVVPPVKKKRGPAKAKQRAGDLATASVAGLTPEQHQLLYGTGSGLSSSGAASTSRAAGGTAGLELPVPPREYFDNQAVASIAAAAAAALNEQQQQNAQLQQVLAGLPVSAHMPAHHHHPHSVVSTALSQSASLAASLEAIDPLLQEQVATPHALFSATSAAASTSVPAGSSARAGDISVDAPPPSGSSVAVSVAGLPAYAHAPAPAPAPPPAPARRGRPRKHPVAAAAPASAAQAAAAAPASSSDSTQAGIPTTTAASVPSDSAAIAAAAAAAVLALPSSSAQPQEARIEGGGDLDLQGEAASDLKSAPAATEKEKAKEGRSSTKRAGPKQQQEVESQGEAVDGAEGKESGRNGAEAGDAAGAGHAPDEPDSATRADEAPSTSKSAGTPRRGSARNATRSVADDAYADMADEPASESRGDAATSPGKDRGRATGKGKGKAAAAGPKGKRGRADAQEDALASHDMEDCSAAAKVDGGEALDTKEDAGADQDGASPRTPAYRRPQRRRQSNATEEGAGDELPDGGEGGEDGASDEGEYYEDDGEGGKKWLSGVKKGFMRLVGY